MKTTTSLRERLEAAVMEFHCANHAMTEKWAAGKLSTNAMAGWAIEHWHWVSKMPKTMLYTCANAPVEVQRILLENYNEENDPAHSHLDIVLRFAAANGADIDAVKRGRGLPTTESWVAWLTRVAKEESFIASVAALNIGTESQSPLLYGRVLPALRSIYKFKEDDIEHFWLHVEADTEHGGRAFDILEKYCTTPELEEMAIHYARESSRMRSFYFDGIYLYYETGYKFR